MEGSWAILANVRPSVLKREDKKREGKQRKGEKRDGFVTNTSQILAKTTEAEHTELTLRLFLELQTLFFFFNNNQWFFLPKFVFKKPMIL